MTEYRGKNFRKREREKEREKGKRKRREGREEKRTVKGKTDNVVYWRPGTSSPRRYKN